MSFEPRSLSSLTESFEIVGGSLRYVCKDNLTNRVTVIIAHRGQGISRTTTPADRDAPDFASWGNKDGGDQSQRDVDVHQQLHDAVTRHNLLKLCREFF